MTILGKLSSSLGRQDQVPNQELAKKIAKEKDKTAIKELIELLNGKNKNLQGDSIKVLYEIGEQNPELVAPYAKDFLALLDGKNNRLIWGAMTALDCIAALNPKMIYGSLVKIVKIADEGSVITRDHAVGILTKLCAEKEFAKNAFPLLIEQMKKCPTNQLPKYAEDAISIVGEREKALFIKTLSARLKEIESDTKRKRVEKVIKKLS